MAISKKRKEELVLQYIDWLNHNQALILTKYIGLGMNQIDDLRVKLRAAGGEFHIIKNTLAKVAFDQAGWTLPEDFLMGSTAVAFSPQDAPSLAKAITEFARDSEFVKIKGGYLDGRVISQDEVVMLGQLPPLPVLRAILLGTLMAPASKLARTLVEPARQITAVLKAYADKDASAATA